MLQSMLAERLGEGAVEIRTSGFGPVDLPPIDDAVDVILTAERDHVVKIAALSPEAFRRAMTLPEFLSYAADALVDPGAAVGDAGGDAVRRWIEQLTASRRAVEYLRDRIPEVADPTGSMPKAFEAAVVAIEQQCREAAMHFSARAH